MKRLICVLLVLLMLPVWVVSCTKNPANTNIDDPSVSDEQKLLESEGRIMLVRDGAAIYRVVRPEKGIGSAALLAGELIDAVNAKCGIELGICMDDEAAADYEILIGDTNRPESQTALANLTDSTFSVSVSGNKIVIAAKNDIMLSCAMTYFFDTYINTVPAVEGIFSVENIGSYTSGSDFIVFDKPADGNYLVTYPQSEKDYQVLASYGTDTLYNLESFAANIYNKLKDTKVAGVVLSSDKLYGITEPKAEWKEILIGGTSREATKSVKATLGYDEYAIKVVDNDIVITGLGYVSTKAAVEKFLEFIEFFKDESSGKTLYRLPADFSYKSTTTGNSRWPAAPEYTGGVLDSVTDAGNDSFVAVYTQTTKEEYAAYLTSLEAAGYTKYFENDMNGNLYAVYKTDAVVINAYFIPYSSSAYIVAESAYKVTLPALEADNVYTDKGIQSSITQMKLNNVTDSNGQCHVFRLCDGRFIIVDGGGNDKAIDNTTKKTKTDADNLMDLLKKMSGDEKPVVAAWFITHLHSDHYSVLLQFAEDYKDAITVESFIYNFPPASMINGDTTKTEQNVEKAMSAFAGAKKIRAHTGQKYYIANATIEMLMAPEMICPNYITFYNDTSTVFMVDIGGTKTLITGDASPNTSKIMCNMYGDYLQCDILQISHHGSYGCSVEFYEYTNPTKIAFLPVGITQKGRLTNQAENVYISKLVKIVPHYQGTTTVELPIK